MNDIRFDLDRFRGLIDKRGGVSVVAREINLDTSLVNRHYNGNENRPLTAKYIGTYCNYFNVSPDYLFGLTPVSSSDNVIRLICEYTGLTDNAVTALSDLLQSGNDNYNFVISELIETVIPEITSLIVPEYETAEKSLITGIVHYLEADFLNNGKILNVALSGNLIDPMNTDRKIQDEILTDYRNIISLEEIKVSEVVEQLLLNSIIESLKEFKRKSKISELFNKIAYTENNPCDDISDDDLPF